MPPFPTAYNQYADISGGNSNLGAQNFYDRVFFGSASHDENQSNISRLFCKTDYDAFKQEVKDPYDGTCEWFQNCQVYQHWSITVPSSLCLIGSPGSGKSVLAKHLVTTSKSRMIYFFCNRNNREHNTAISILLSLIHQCVMLEGQSGRQVKAMYDKWDHVLCTSHGRLGELFGDIMSISQYGEWSCIIDGFDYCDMVEREKLLQSLAKGFKAKDSAWNLRLLIMSRPCGEIKTEIRSWKTAKIQTFVDEKETSSQSDIFKYIEGAVEDFDHYSLEQKTKVIETLKREANGSFEWVVHLISALKKSSSDCSQDPLAVPLPAMDKASSDLIDRATPERLALLQMLAVMKGPLTPSAFTAIGRIHENPFPNCFDIGGKVDTIDSSILLGEEALRVPNGHLQLVHPTLKDYICKHMTKPEFHEIHRKVAETCLLYLATIGADRNPIAENFPEKCLDEYRELLAESPYLPYAATFWSYHVRNAGPDAMLLWDMIHRTFQSEDVRNLAFQVHQFVKTDEYIGGQSLLHLLVHHGLVSLTEQLLSSERSHEITLNDRDGKGRIALWWAVENNSYEMVKLLLKTPNVSFDSRDQDDVSPAFNAVINNRIDILRLFLATGEIAWNEKNKAGKTFLTWAAANGRHHVVEELLRSDGLLKSKEEIRPDQTAIVLAARNGSKSVVQLLLECKAHQNSLDNTVSGRSALSWAAGNGYKDVVAVLLANQNVGLDQRDPTFDRTAFHWAAYIGDGKIASMILEEICRRDESRAGEKARSLLFEAATKGQAVALDILLESTRIDDPDCLMESRTPLSLAAEQGHDQVVLRLISTGKVNINSADAQRRTPLIYASKGGSSKVVKALLAQSDIDLNVRDLSGRTAKEWADSNSRDKILKLINDKETLLFNSRATST